MDIIREKRDYTGFDRLLKKTFEYNMPDSKRILEHEMTQKGFRRKKVKGKNGKYYLNNQYPVSENQLNHTWDYLNSIRPRQERLKYEREPETRIFNFSIERNNRTRANKPTEYNNKVYRKGQFLPYKIREE